MITSTSISVLERYGVSNGEGGGSGVGVGVGVGDVGGVAVGGFPGLGELPPEGGGELAPGEGFGGGLGGGDDIVPLLSPEGESEPPKSRVFWPLS